MPMLHEIAYTASTWVLPALLAITLHEAAHGFVARQLGDDTAARLGRVSINPFRHIDPIGTVLIPALILFASGGRFLFGYAKPVPVNFARLRNPRRDMILVALAGPAANFVLATSAALLLNLLFFLPQTLSEWVGENLINAIILNLILAIFNLLPLPPLDGGRVAVGVLPYGLAMRYARLERVGMAIILFALFVLPWIGQQVGLDLHLFHWLVLGPVNWLLPGFEALANLI